MNRRGAGRAVSPRYVDDRRPAVPLSIPHPLTRSAIPPRERLGAAPRGRRHTGGGAWQRPPPQPPPPPRHHAVPSPGPLAGEWVGARQLFSAYLLHCRHRKAVAPRTGAERLGCRPRRRREREERGGIWRGPCVSRSKRRHLSLRRNGGHDGARGLATAAAPAALRRGQSRPARGGGEGEWSGRGGSDGGARAQPIIAILMTGGHGGKGIETPAQLETQTGPHASCRGRQRPPRPLTIPTRFARVVPASCRREAWRGREAARLPARTERSSSAGRASKIPPRPPGLLPPLLRPGSRTHVRGPPAPLWSTLGSRRDAHGGRTRAALIG